MYRRDYNDCKAIMPDELGFIVRLREMALFSIVFVMGHFGQTFSQK